MNIGKLLGSATPCGYRRNNSNWKLTPIVKPERSAGQTSRLLTPRSRRSGDNMTRFKTAWAIVLVLMIAGSGFAKSTKLRESNSRAAQIDKECRQALVDAAKWEAEAQLLGKQVEELKAQVAAGKAESDKLREAIAKHEAAIAAQDRADARVAELRLNYEKQVANAEKLLAIEQGKTSFWRTMARVGLFVGVLVGGVLGYMLGSK